MDTGASLMATPPSIYEDFINKVTNDTNCDDYSTFPKIGF